MNHHQKALKAADSYHRSVSELLDVLIEMQKCEGYYSLGYRSLTEYGKMALKLSEDVAHHFSVIARKSIEVPKLQELFASGGITFTNARRVAVVLTPENQDQWLLNAQAFSRRELEHAMAELRPELSVPDQAHYFSKDRVELRFGISQALYEKFLRVQDLVSSKTKTAASFEQTLEAALDLYLHKNDPLEKAKRSNSSVSERKTDRVPSTPLEHQITLRDQAQCTKIRPDGSRYPEKRWLEHHHMKHFSKGGETTLENLTTLCSAHHRMIHQTS